MASNLERFEAWWATDGSRVFKRRGLFKRHLLPVWEAAITSEPAKSAKADAVTVSDAGTVAKVVKAGKSGGTSKN